MSLSDRIYGADGAPTAPGGPAGAKVPMSAKLKCGKLAPLAEKIDAVFPTIVSKCEGLELVFT
jgi:hypothetical protein